MTRSAVRLAMLGLLLSPLGLLLEFRAGRARVVLASSSERMTFQIDSGRGLSRWWVPPAVAGVFVHASPGYVRELGGDGFALRRESMLAESSLASLKALGAMLVAGAVIFDPAAMAPVAAQGQTHFLTVLSDAQHTIQVEWPERTGVFAISGVVHRLISQDGQPPWVAAVAKRDEGLATHVAWELSQFIAAFPERFRARVRQSLPQVLIVSNWEDLDLGTVELEFPGSNVWIGPLPRAAASLRSRLARLAAQGWLISEAAAFDGAVAVASSAWGELWVQAHRGRDVESDDLLRQALAYRAVRTIDWTRPSSAHGLTALESARAIELFGPTATALLGTRMDRDPGTDLQASLIAWLLDPERTPKPHELIDVENAKRLALDELERNSCIESSPDERGWHSSTRSWEFVGEHAGYLETCGCKATEGGGVIDLVSRWSSPPPEHTHRLSLGNELATPDREGFVPAGNALILETLRELHLTAFVPGDLELACLESNLISRSDLDCLPSVACNVRVRDTAELVFAPYVDLPGSPQAPPVRVVGVIKPTMRKSAPYLREPLLASFEFDDPTNAVSKVLSETPEEVEVVLVGDLMPADLRGIASLGSRPLLAISRLRMVPRMEAGLTQREQHDGRIGNIAVVFSSGAAYDLLTAQHDPILHATVTTAERLSDIPSDESARGAFRTRIQGVLERDQPAVELTFYEPLSAAGRSYVGSEACKGCHADQFEQWLSTPHSTAMLTLERAQRQRVNNCVACHTVGFGTASGYRMNAPRAELRNVGCEVCHGPGSDHCDGRPASIRRSPSDELCASCHTLAHSNFLLSDPAEFRRKVEHGAEKTP